MDQRLKMILETLLRNIDALNGEVVRLTRSEQFTPTMQCFQLIETIRSNCLCSLQNLRTVERKLYKSKPPAEGSKPADVLLIK